MKSITVPRPTLEHAIRLRAYDLYVRRGMDEGHADHDWLAAEAELLDGHSSDRNGATGERAQINGKLTDADQP
jgi:hypothetical protein